MNLVDMVSRNDQNLEFQSEKKPSLLNWNGQNFRGFMIQSKNGAILEIKHPFNWYPYSMDELNTGWKLIPQGKVSKNAIVCLDLLDNNNNVLISHEIKIEKTDSEVSLNLPDLKENKNKVSKLRLSMKGKNGFLNYRNAKVFLAVHETLDRKILFDQCVGKGVELGPGHNPQVKPSEKTEVYFVEQMSPSQWNELYNKNGKYEVDTRLWSFYKIGEAHSIPADENSLDFIFSSHVFEHLANPLAHLEHWQRKLKNGGKVLAIVPDVGGCKDYVYKPSNLSEIIEEWKLGGYTPTLKHYERWAKHRAPGQDPQEFMKANRSIHCHFYSRDNIIEILEFATSRLGFTSWKVYHSKNHKDFYFQLQK